VTDLSTLPAVRALAEDDARKHHEALAAVINRNDLPTQAPTLPAWENLPPSYRDMRVAAVVARLTSMDPASRDAIARLVADAVGLECGATAPRFAADESHEERVWYMTTEHSSHLFWQARSRCWIIEGDHVVAGRATDVPGISTLTDPTAALTAIALRVLGGDRG